MEFVRKKKRGQNQKVRRTWFTEEGYRIVWRKEVCGVRVPTRYQATVRTVIPNYSGEEGESVLIWDFTDPQPRLFKVMSKAHESCERHRRLWVKACEATGIRGLVDVFGKLPTTFPFWVRNKLNRKVHALLNRPQVGKSHEEEEESCSNPSAPPEISATSPTNITGSDGPKVGPVLPAEDEGGTTTRTTRRARSKAPSIEINSPVNAVKGKAKERKKPAARRTKRQSPGTKKKPKRTTRSSGSGKKPSAVSRKNKSTP